MEVAVTELRSHLKDWIAHVQAGAEIVVTDRGVPVARIMGVEATATLERLIQTGAIARPRRATRPVARGRIRPRAVRSVADRISEQRR